MNWQQGPRESDGGPSTEIWMPDIAGHKTDPRLRAKLMENPGLTIIMVHASAMRSSNPCWLILSANGCAKCSRFHVKGKLDAIQMAPHIEGTLPCAWLETYDEVVIDELGPEGVVWQDWTPTGRWVANGEAVPQP